MIKRATLSLLFAVATLAASAQVPFVTGTTEELYAKGKSENKLIFVDIYASWCPPCKMMDRDVFSREDVGKFMGGNFVNVKHNIDEGVGREMAQQYGISSIPTYLVFNADGKLVSRITGAMGADDFIARMQSIIDSQK